MTQKLALLAVLFLCGSCAAQAQTNEQTPCEEVEAHFALLKAQEQRNVWSCPVVGPCGPAVKPETLALFEKAVRLCRGEPAIGGTLGAADRAIPWQGPREPVRWFTFRPGVFAPVSER